MLFDFNKELSYNSLAVATSNCITKRLNYPILSSQVELENRTGSSLSNCKDPADLEGWEKEGGSNAGSGNGTLIGSNGRTLPPIVSSPNNAPTPPSYHLTTSSPSYLYPEGFSRMSLKVLKENFTVFECCFTDNRPKILSRNIVLIISFFFAAKWTCVEQWRISRVQQLRWPQRHRRHTKTRSDYERFFVGGTHLWILFGRANLFARASRHLKSTQPLPQLRRLRYITGQYWRLASISP